MRLRWLARLLLPRLQHWAATRPGPGGVPGEPNFRINKMNPADGEPVDYLRRWHLVRSSWWHPGLYLHNMLGDDDAVRHTHPYWSLSLVLSDGLEEVYVLDPPLGPVLRRYPSEGQLIWRSSDMAHQLRVLDSAWTLFLTGPRLAKGWGFWCPSGLISYERYTRRSERSGPGTGTSGVGAGCGED